ncbi:MAG: hypothetical protein ACKO99_01830, partial [Dolichospermum sp.]
SLTDEVMNLRYNFYQKIKQVFREFLRPVNCRLRYISLSFQGFTDFKHQKIANSLEITITSVI